MGGLHVQAVYTGLCALLWGKCGRGIWGDAFGLVEGSGCNLESEHEIGGYMERDEETVGVDLKLGMPDFKTEAEEAAWWPTQEEALGKAFEKAAKYGSLKRAYYTLKGATLATLIRLDPVDIELAKKQAE